MLLSDGLEICKSSLNIKFSELFKDIYADEAEILKDIKKNKGKKGQMLEKLCGLDLNTRINDFEDGELETLKMGQIKKESSFNLTALNSWIDELLKDKILPFEDSRLHQKTNKFILMQINKDDENPLNWFFRKCNLYDGSKGTPLFDKLKCDYEAISRELKKIYKVLMKLFTQLMVMKTVLFKFEQKVPEKEKTNQSTLMFLKEKLQKTEV